MATESKVTVGIFSRNNRDLAPSQGSITRIDYDKKDRTQNAVKTLFMWLGFTLASVFVPIAHYFLVPGCFITAFVLALDKLNEPSRNLGGEGACPKCHQQFPIEKSKWVDRFTDTCSKCHDDLEIKIPQ